MSDQTVETLQVVLRDPAGWHIRPIAAFSELVLQSACEVTVNRPGGEAVRGDSLVSLLSMAVRGGETLEVTVRGHDASSVANRLKALFDA